MPKKKQQDEELSENEKQLLVLKLQKYLAQSKSGEDARTANDLRGAALREGKSSSRSSLLSNNLTVFSNIATTYYERLVENITRNKPIPQVDPVGHDDADTARLLQGALIANWDYSNMQMKIEQALLIAGFTRPCLTYTYFDFNDREGIGEINTDIIEPGDCIIDDTKTYIKDMDFAGFKRGFTRADLIKKFPWAAEDIKNAAADGGKGVNSKGNPLRGGAGGGDNTVTRIAPSLTPQGRRTSSYGSRGAQLDGYVEKVEVAFMWIKDPSTTTKPKAKTDDLRRPIRKLVRDEITGEIQFETDGYQTVDSPMGPLLQPNLKPKTEVAMEEAVVNKYPRWRHIAFIIQDGVILWDVNWKRRIPLVCYRDHLPLTGYWVTGIAQRAISLMNARNTLMTLATKSLTVGQTGAWLASTRSGITMNQLLPIPGKVYKAKLINPDNIRPFPTSTVDPIFIQMITYCEQEIMKLFGISGIMQGEAMGRVDNEGTYDKLLDVANTAIQSKAAFLEQSIKEWSLIEIDLMQDYYTHEHMVPMEQLDGTTSWKSASALAIDGDFDVKIETGSMVTYSESAQFDRAAKLYGMGIYTMPTFCKIANIPAWKEALKAHLEILQLGQPYQFMLGASGAGPATQAKAAAPGKRSHHSPLTKK